ncbi:hypothetical protein [Sphingorhabdus lacus]|uniref:DUF4124 domain-containing protein n=1 Tax=Sphingorhabdus lacus TaxID=392610 RepID=A0A6I6L541_9SPHN|nr:hypothetical protein [Sphingorhabdus lacus]QGY79301.1 hypothetical protein EUU25_00890 [Sphingorhabdus lacus]
MRKICAIFVTLGFAASVNANGPAANFIEGRYYLAGDSNCRWYEIASPTRITCLDKDGEPNGHFRDALDDDQLRAFQNTPAGPSEEQLAYQRAYQAQQARELADQLRQTGDYFREIARTTQQAPVYTAPEAAPITQAEGETIICLRAGIYVRCRK